MIDWVGNMERGRLGLRFVAEGSGAGRPLSILAAEEHIGFGDSVDEAAEILGAFENLV